MPGQVRVLAYFPNLILLSSFLGLGIGCLLAERPPLLRWWPSLLLALVGLAVAGSHVAFTGESLTEHLWLLYQDLPRTAPVWPGIRLPILTAFVLSAAVFIPLGQLVAHLLRQFPRPLVGYCWDIGGSLAGVLLFGLLGFLGAFPVVWFCLTLALSVLFLRRQLLWWLLPGLAILGLVHGFERGLAYSPYYALSYQQQGELGLAILANGSLHQQAMNLGTLEKSSNDIVEAVRSGYHRPYSFLGSKPRKALVIGAGSGNDLAVMLSQGVESITAVEVDPVIVKIGRTMHPNRPYDSPKIRVVNTDARSFLETTPEKFDLIVFGTLDSMTRLSALSSVRLDNFVYTLECLREARRHLSDTGGLVLCFMVSDRFVYTKLLVMLTEAFGQAPVVEKHDSRMFNALFLAGPAFEHLDGEARRAKAAEFNASAERAGVPVPTDDWPYLYLQTPGINSFYATLIAAILGLAVLMVAVASGEMRRSLLTARGSDPVLFLFGAAFLLLETRAVTQMSLVWGATWLTSAVVFASILLTVLAASLTALWRTPGLKLTGAGLLLSVLVIYAVPVHWLLWPSWPQRLAVSLALVAPPIFFASLAFSVLFARRTSPGTAFGWNLLGAVCGGLLEFTGMVIGLRALLLVVLALYALALVLAAREEQSAPV